MFLIAGLGNPGNKYEQTRHNLGFMAVERLASSSEPWKEQHKALTQKVSIGRHSVVLAKPQTYMNLSGESIQPLLSWYKIPISNLIVLVDDVALECGRLRVRGQGSHGGQNGLRSIIDKMGNQFARVRVGAGKAPPNWDLADWVLSQLTKDDAKLCSEALSHIPEVVRCLLDEGLNACMAKYNGPLP
jgi:peptidyl-tRNA hydrolase, PTH1 family